MHICEYCEWGKPVTRPDTGETRCGCTLSFLAYPLEKVPRCETFTLSRECVETGNHPETPEEELTAEDHAQAATWKW